jgi:hypothetical protein
LAAARRRVSAFLLQRRSTGLFAQGRKRSCKSIVMLNEVKHLADFDAISWRCFAALNMTMRLLCISTGDRQTIEAIDFDLA